MNSSITQDLSHSKHDFDRQSGFNFAFWRIVSGRYLRPSRKDGAISLIALLSFFGIMLGVAALIIVMSVMNGFRTELMRSIVGFNGHIGAYSRSPDGIQDFDLYVDRLKGFGEIDRVTPIIDAHAILCKSGRAAGVIVHGTRLLDLEKRTPVSANIIQGSLEDFHNGPTVVIGKRLAEQYGIYVGDRISLMSPQGHSTAFGTVPRVRSFMVKAIFEAGMRDFDSNFAFIPLEQAQTFFNYSDTINAMEIFLKDPNRAQTFAQQLRITEPAIRFVDWQQANQSFFNTLKVERNVMFLILSLVVLVAALNIASSMIMLVKDKAKAIAIFRTLGARRRDITVIISLVGSYIGFAGIGAGTAIGLLFCQNIEGIRRFLERLLGTELFSQEIYFLSSLPAELHKSDVVAILLFSILLVLFSSLIPAMRAARLDPVETLRYE